MSLLEKAVSFAYHTRLHHPVIDGQRIESIPYLTLPFRRTELVASVNTCDYATNLTSWRPYAVSEGFFYSKPEQQVHGKVNHGAVDWFAPYGTPIVAPCDGIAMSSYYSLLLRHADGTPRQMDGKDLYYGLGYFVQILAPNGRIVQLAHLSDIAGHIPFSKPVFDSRSDIWMPTNHAIVPAELEIHPMAIHVSRGDPIGSLGYSGLRKGYADYYEGMDRPYQIDPSLYKSWDREHLHMEEASRNYHNGKKEYQRDIYDLYAEFMRYPDPFNGNPIGSQTLFELDVSERPKYTP